MSADKAEPPFQAVSDFLIRAQKRLPDGYEPLTLARLPDAITKLQIHERTLESCKARGLTIVDHNMKRLKQQVGDFITQHLIKNGAEGAKQIANLMKRAAAPKVSESDHKEVSRIGRRDFLALIYSKDFILRPCQRILSLKKLPYGRIPVNGRKRSSNSKVKNRTSRSY